jgi:hypothetical protein
LTFGGWEHVVLEHSTQELSRSSTTQEGIEVNIANPPDDIGVSFAAKGRESHKGDPKEP